jgi:hypothetical protein
MLYVELVAEQDASVAETVIRPVIASPVILAELVKVGIFPVPDKPNPIPALLLVQLNDAPTGVLTNAAGV